MGYVGAAAALIGAAYGIYSGERSASAASEANRKQEKAQKESVAQAAAAQRRAMEEQRKATRKTPDMLSLMNDSAGGLTGPSSTMLTGSTGMSRAGTRLGSTSLLGG